ncbi:MAG: response regulator [Archangiaceae bacterium]|nr:response regulator [Archangiaceae bacterium]
MPTLPGPIWMVDDEAELVGATVAMLSRDAGDEVRGSTDPREVAMWIEQTRPAVLITDVRMPHLSGLELVTRLHRRWGPVPVIIITAFPTAQVDTDVRAGRFAYLPKPFTFQVLREAVLRVTQQPASSAFSGAIAVSMLGEVVQLYGLANRSGVLRVESPSGVGEIHFDAGRVVDAVAPQQRGVEAFNTILGWSSGQFSWLVAVPTEHTIHLGLSELLLEAYRVRDEAEAGHTAAPVPSGFDELDLALDGLMPGGVPTEQVKRELQRLGRAEGFLGAALFDLESNQCLASLGDGGASPIEHAVSGHADLVQAKQRTIAKLDLHDELEDIVISLSREYHLVRLVKRQPRLFFFLTLDRARANLAMARYLLSDVEKDMVV